MRLTSDTLQELEFSGEFCPPPIHLAASFVLPTDHVVLFHLRKLSLTKLTVDQAMILMLATFNLIQVPQLETLLLSELQGGFHMALMFVGTEHLVGLGSIRELVIQDTKTNPTPSDTLTNMLHHLTGLEVLSLDGFSYEQDDEWLEALSWTNPSDGSAVYMPTQYMTRPDLKRLTESPQVGSTAHESRFASSSSCGAVQDKGRWGVTVGGELRPAGVHG